MIGSYDFCGHYEWTFEWLMRRGGEELVQAFWAHAIGEDSQSHAVKLIQEKGFSGMSDYWAHTLAEENAGYHTTLTNDVFRLDMHECPSKGFLLMNGLKQFPDYCDHCIGWIGPMMKSAGFQVHHEHNHCGQCWWEFRKRDDTTAASEPATFAGKKDVRVAPSWPSADEPIDVFRGAFSATDKEKPDSKRSD